MIGVHDAADAVHLRLLEVAVERVAVRDCAAGNARSERERTIPPASAQAAKRYVRADFRIRL